ncbi:MAG TPA: sulfotransferase [Solirubrobacterales bacterium]|jgi:hypothetical protein
MESASANAPGRVPAPFIVGVARSGTTLLRLMLDAHPELAIPPETHFVPRFVKFVEKGAGPGEAHEFVTQHQRWPDWGLDADELRARFFAIEPFTAGDAVRAFFGLYAEKQGKRRWGDKTPGHLGRMGRIHRALPEARFLHVIRDGRDAALSLLERSWGPDTISEAATAWREGIEKARRQARRRLPEGVYIEVRYEELVREPEATLRAAARAIDLPWDERMLRYHEVAEERMAEVGRDLERDGGTRITAAERAAQHALVREPPRPDRIGRWRTELPADARRRFEEVAGDLLEELGYPLD